MHITFAGGGVPIEGNFASFNQLNSSRKSEACKFELEYDASGNASGDRNARGSNNAATIFASAQPVIVGMTSVKCWVV